MASQYHVPSDETGGVLVSNNDKETNVFDLLIVMSTHPQLTILRFALVFLIGSQFLAIMFGSLENSFIHLFVSSVKTLYADHNAIVWVLLFVCLCLVIYIAVLRSDINKRYKPRIEQLKQRNNELSKKLNKRPLEPPNTAEHKTNYPHAQNIDKGTPFES